MSEWEEIKLGLVAEIQTGPFGSQLHQKDYVPVGTPLITVKNLGDNKVTYNKLDFVSDEDKERLSKFILKEGDIVFSRVGYVDRRAFITNNECGWMFSGSTLRIRVKKASTLDSKYLSYYFGQKNIKEEIINLSVGATRPSLNTQLLEELDIIIPPFPEQKAIALVLSSLDDKIDLLHRQNKTLEAMAKTLFRQWFMEKAQEDWEDGKIPDEFDYEMGTSPPGESYNKTGAGIPMFQGNAEFEFRFPKKRLFTTDPKKFAEKHDTLISVRAPVGAQNMANEKCCIGRGVAAFRYKSNNDYYTYTYFKMKSLMEEIKQFNDTGTVFGSMSKGDFEAFDILLPPVDLVNRFQIEVKPIDDKVISNTNQIRTLEKLRDTLLPKLMSCEVRVKI